jgi:hypothetical protein
MLLYRYIKVGKLSRTPDGLIDTAELLRAGLLLQSSDVTPLHDVTTLPVTPEASVTSPVTPTTSSETRTLERLIDVLQRELAAARERETLLLQMLSQMQQQHQRLLDMPRQAAQDAPHAPQTPRRVRSHPAPQDAPPGQPGAPYADARGTMRRQILALLQDHPEGLTPAEMRTLLGVGKRLAQTCIGMWRDGWLQRVGKGTYVASEASRPPA